MNTITSSRTGTTKWRKLRAQVIEEAINNNIFNCPSCRVGLDYEYSGRPNSVEIDHKMAVANGGEDVIENLQVLCKLCNQTKGSGKREKKIAARIETETRIEW